jgi:hypothetical protein
VPATGHPVSPDYIHVVACLISIDGNGIGQRINRHRSKRQPMALHLG